MSEKFSFTDNKIQALKLPSSGQTTYRDSEVRSLIVRVSYAGAKAFVLYKKFQGRPRMITIGTFPEYNVAEAREIAINLKRQMAKGILPKTQSDSETSISTNLGIFEGLYIKYLDDYAKHNLTPRGIGDLTARVKRNANLLFKKTLRDITKQDILDIFHKTSNVGRVEANRTISYLSAIFNKGIEWELVDKNPVFGIKKHKEHSRDRYITLEEKEQFLNALDAEKDQQIKDFVYISLYTGARKSNVLSMRWEDISFDQGVWYIEDTKNGDPQNVVLIEDAVKILERRKLKSKSEWVFPSKDSKSGHFQEPRKGWVRICKRAGIEDLRIHDLRRTCGSWMALNGASQYIIGKMLGHKSPQSTAIYARLSLDPVREHMEKAINLKNGDLQRKIEELKRKQEEENNL